MSKELALVEVFKSLADPARLRMIGLMVDEPRCGQELATELGLAPATVSHHLRRLREAGLLRERREGAYVLYQLDHEALRKAVQTVADKKKVVKLAAGPELAREERKVLESFFEGDRLLRIPAQRSKKEIVFEEILRRLPRREVYTERELSRLLEDFHPDFCTIRRELIMGRYMVRDRQRYRLAARGRAVVLFRSEHGEYLP
jgi:biotin operon repressor